MDKNQIAIKSLQSFTSVQGVNTQETCRKHPLLLDFRAIEIISTSPLSVWSDNPVTVANSMKQHDVDGQVIESKSLSSSTRHIFSGLVEIIDPQVVDGGVEYGTFRIIEVKSAFPDLPIGKLIFAHVDKERHFASFGILWTYASETERAERVAAKVEDEIDFKLLATRSELIDAFGKYTGMNKSWFDNLTDAPKLMAARKYKGKGGRGSFEPLFCPYEVMQWLAAPNRKKGRQLNEMTAWRILKSNFPKVYNLYSIGDPNAD